MCSTCPLEAFSGHVSVTSSPRALTNLLQLWTEGSRVILCFKVHLLAWAQLQGDAAVGYWAPPSCAGLCGCSGWDTFGCSRWCWASSGAQGWLLLLLLPSIPCVCRGNWTGPFSEPVVEDLRFCSRPFHTVKANVLSSSQGPCGESSDPCVTSGGSFVMLVWLGLTQELACGFPTFRLLRAWLRSLESQGWENFGTRWGAHWMKMGWPWGSTLKFFSAGPVNSRGKKRKWASGAYLVKRDKGEKKTLRNFIQPWWRKSCASCRIPAVPKPKFKQLLG